MKVRRFTVLTEGAVFVLLACRLYGCMAMPFERVRGRVFTGRVQEIASYLSGAPHRRYLHSTLIPTSLPPGSTAQVALFYRRRHIRGGAGRHRYWFSAAGPGVPVLARGRATGAIIVNTSSWPWLPWVRWRLELMAPDLTDPSSGTLGASDRLSRKNVT